MSNGQPRFSLIEPLEGRTLLSTVSIAAVDAVAAETGDTSASLVVSRDSAEPTDLVAKLRFGGTAANGRDYQQIGKTVTIPANQTQAIIPLTVLDDSKLELTELAVVTILPSSTYQVNPSASSATVTIADDEKPTVNVVARPAVASEAKTDKPGCFIFTRNGPKTEALTVAVVISGTATNGTDYQQITNVVIPVKASKVNIPVTVINDQLAEGSETVVATLQDASTQTVGSKSVATVTIADNDFDTATYFPLTLAYRQFRLRARGIGTATADVTMTPSGQNSLMRVAVDADNYVQYGYRMLPDGLFQQSWREVVDSDFSAGDFSTLPKLAPAVLELGQIYSGAGVITDGGSMSVTTKAIKAEVINTPMGRFECVKVELVEDFTSSSWTEANTITLWLNKDHGIMKWQQATRYNDSGQVGAFSFTALALS